MRSLWTNLILTFFVCVLLVSGPFRVLAGSPPLQKDSGSFADLAERLLPSVVNISSTQVLEDPEDFPGMPQFPPGSPFEEFFEDFLEKRGQGVPETPVSSLGSGFIIDAKNGYVVTNNHVVKDADEVRITLYDDTTLDAEIVGRDEKIDLAVLKIKTEHPLVAVPFGDSGQMRVGDWIVAIGNPFGLGGTVTAGIVSAQQRDINAGPYDDFIQTDASINRGNSGGPMFNLKGEVIGINTAIFSPSGGSVGIGFAIPSNLAKPVLDQLVKYGRTRRGWLGVRIQSVTDEIAESLGLKETKGALVASVTADGPAEKAGVQAGDVILDFNGKPIHEMRELPRIVAETEIDSKVPLKVWRDAKSVDLKVAVGELEKAEEEGLLTTGIRKTGSEGSEIKSVGLFLKDIGSEERKKFDLESGAQGVVVSFVTDLSEAAKKGILPGDVVSEINQQAISSTEKALDIFRKAEKAGRRSVLLLVNRRGDARFVALRLDGTPEEE